MSWFLLSFKTSQAERSQLGESVLWLLLNLTVFSYPNPQNLTLHARGVFLCAGEL